MSSSTDLADAARIIKTGIPNLDYLLTGGLRPIDGRFPSVLVRGGAGTGKTVLCSTIARNIFRQNKSVAYFVLEQRIADIRALFCNFAAGSDIFELSLQDLQDRDITKYKDPPTKPVFLLSEYQLTMRTAEDDLETDLHEDEPSPPWYIGLDTFIRTRITWLKDAKPGIIVLDSLSEAVREQNDPEFQLPFSLRRLAFLGLCNAAATIAPEALVLLVLETPRPSDWRDFVADVVIEMGGEGVLGESQSDQRYIRVCKARNQQIIHGKHRMQIGANAEIEVFPAVRSVLEHEAARMKAKAPAKQSPSLFCANKSFIQFLDKSNSNPAEFGQSTLLYGQDGTLKNAVAISFLQEALPQGGKTLFLAIGLTEDLSHRWIQRYTGESAAASNILIEMIGGPYQAVDEIVDRIRRILDKAGVMRVAVNDISSPGASDELVLAMNELFSVRGIPCLFVQTVEVDQRGYPESKYRELFSNVIRSRCVELPNVTGLRIAYKVLRWDGATRSDRSWELRHASDGQFSLTDSFEDLVETMDGSPRTLPLSLQLYYPFESLNRFWERESRVIFNASDRAQTAESPKVTAFGRFEAQTIFESIRNLPPDPVLSDAVVVNLDDPWTDELIQSGRLERLDPYLTESTRWNRDEFNTEAMGVCEPVDGQGLYALPHHLDVGFYTLRLDLFDMLQRDIGRKLSPDDLDWNDIEELHRASRRLSDERTAQFGAQFGKLRRVEPLPNFTPIRAFGCSANEIEESYLCFLVEVLWPLLKTKGMYADLSDLGSPRFVEAVARLYCHLRNLDVLPFRPITAEPPPVVSDVASLRQDVLVERHWYVSYREKIRANPGLEGLLQIIRPPMLTMTDPADKHRARQMSGDWYLGIVKGSGNPRRGVRSLLALTNETANRQMFHAGIGLPARNILMEFGEKKAVFASRDDQRISRRMIPNYHRVRSILIDGFLEIFTPPAQAMQQNQGWEEALPRIKEILSKMHGEIEKRGGPHSGNMP